MKSTDVRNRCFQKITLRLIPFMFTLYIVAYLDRINLGFAAGQMKQTLGFDDEMIGIAGSVFFVGYFLFQVPANLVLERIGARRWIGAIMVAWGLVSLAEAFVRTREVFYSLRFLLGIAESGFFPGMILYLTYWYPQAERAKAVSRFMTAIPCAGVFGGLISGPLLGLRGLGLHGWQWLYICEAVPAMALGVAVFFYLSDGPADARWLTQEERDWLQAEMALDRERRPGGRTGIGEALLDPRVWLLSLLYFSLVVDLYGISLWLPQIIASYPGLSEVLVGVLSAVPYVLAAIGMVFIGHSSDRTGERRWHVALSAFVRAAGFLITTQATHPALAVFGMALAAFGIWGTLGPFWALPTSFLGGSGAASGIALINAVGNLGGTVGAYVVGALRQRSTSFTDSFLFMSVAAVVAAALSLSLREKK